MSNLHAKDTNTYKVISICGLLGVSKQAYYKYDENIVLHRVAQEAFAVEYIKAICEKAPGIGGMKLWYMYRRNFSGGEPLGRDRFEDVVDKYVSKLRERIRKPRTTGSTHGLPVYPDLIKEKQTIYIIPKIVYLCDRKQHRYMGLTGGRSPKGNPI